MEDMRDFYLNNGIDIPVVTPHQLRHTRLSQLVNSGKNLIAVAKYGGHADMNMLLTRYAHTNTDEMREQLGIE
jgi:integrase